MLGTLALLALIQVPEPTQELWPGTSYDLAVPSLEVVVGHDFREEITAPDDVVRYMEALAEAVPARTRLVRYAESWEGRPLVALVIASAERMARLDQVLAGLERLSSGGLAQAEADALIAELPVVTALMHGIHGNEISSSGAAMAEAYHLLAARGSATVDSILAQSLVIIDPVENPDGRARFVQQNLMARARWPDPTAYSAEHDEPWPGGRTNHYLFDLNRDMFIQSQPESRGRAALFLEYWPQIVVDLHEMGGNSTYFFPPTAPPENPWYGVRQIALMDVFGRANARVFDERGFAYFNRDVYDLFYPGYVDGWPMGQGALGMTYEQASARALVLERSDGDMLTYGDGVLHHFTAAISTAATAARNRERILRDYYAFRREGVELGGEGSAREYVLHSASDPSMAERLARMLVLNGIAVHEASGPVSVAGRTLPRAGTYIVPLAQPTARFARNLLDPHVAMAEDFVQRQIERRSRREPDEIYDLTAWSQSLLWDVEALVSPRPTGALGALVTAERATQPTVLPPAVVGYLLPWGSSAAAAVTEALREGIRVRTVGGTFTLGGRSYGVGTALVRTAENGPDLRERLGRIAAGHGAEVVAIDDSYVTEGTSLGAESGRALREPRVLLVYDQPADAYSAGWARYVLERRYGQRTTIVRASSLGAVTLADHDVIVFPSGNFAGSVGEALVDRLRDWMSDGGTVVTMAGSTAWATRAELLSTVAERRGGRPVGEDAPERDTPEQPIEYLEEIVPTDEAPEGVPGAILNVVLDTSHWLAAGTDGRIGALVVGSRVFRPLTLDDGSNVGRYADLDGLVASGIVWEESRPQLASKAFLMYEPVGDGQIIGFAEDPNYRAYTEATQLLFMNAVLLGPGR